MCISSISIYIYIVPLLFKMFKMCIILTCIACVHKPCIRLSIPNSPLHITHYTFGASGTSLLSRVEYRVAELPNRVICPPQFNLTDYQLFFVSSMPLDYLSTMYSVTYPFHINIAVLLNNKNYQRPI